MDRNPLSQSELTRGNSIKHAILTGIAYMLPFMMTGSILMGISHMGGLFYGIDSISDTAYLISSNPIVRWLHQCNNFAVMALSLMLPVVSGFISFALAGKPGIAPGMIGCLMINKMSFGFFGAIAAGFFAGYSLLWLKKIIMRDEKQGNMILLLFYQVGSTLLTCLFMVYIVSIPLSTFSRIAEHWLLTMSDLNKVVIAAGIGVMVGFDLGGPINKVAVTTSIGLLSAGIYSPNTAAQVAIIIPPLGLGLACLIWKTHFPPFLHSAGIPALIMGLIGLSEGAIPFAIANPRMILINMAGSALGAAMAVNFEAVNTIPVSGFYGWLTVARWPVYILSVMSGSLVVVMGSLWLSWQNPPRPLT